MESGLESAFSGPEERWKLWSRAQRVGILQWEAAMAARKGQHMATRGSLMARSFLFPKGNVYHPGLVFCSRVSRAFDKLGMKSVNMDNRRPESE